MSALVVVQGKGRFPRILVPVTLVRPCTARNAAMRRQKRAIHAVAKHIQWVTESIEQIF